MKRLISLVAVFVALFACSAQADTKRIEEKFTIRNGITYHMHRNDVITAEKEYGTEGSMRDDVMTVLDSESSNGWSSYVDTVRYWPSGGVLGKNSGILNYIFDDNEQLIGLFYSISHGDNDKNFYPGSEAQTDYKRIRSNLIEKYGEPIGEVKNGNGKLLGAHTHRYLQAASFEDVIYTYSNCTQWLVQYDDCYCIIELLIQDSIMEMMSLAGYVQNLSLAYRLVDQNELNMLMNETQQRINEKNRDI